MASRSTEIRDFAWNMSKHYKCKLEADYYDSTKKWEIRWHDGPTAATVMAAVGRQLPKHREIIYTRRYHCDEALVLAAIRLYAAGRGGEYYDLQYAAERFLEDVADPVSTATERETAMVERALDASVHTSRWNSRDAYGALELLEKQRGIGWLLAPPAPAGKDRQPEADAPAGTELALSPLEQLTARYAHGEHLAAWRERGATMPVRAAVGAALADPEADKNASLAALALIPVLQAELDADTASLIDKARGAGGSWADVGRTMGGITKQSASNKYAVLTAARPSANG